MARTFVKAKTKTGSDILMKLLATSDIHQMPSKWKELVIVCKENKIDIACIAGDIYPKEYINRQSDFTKHLKKYALQLKENGTKMVFILGNDDNQELIPDMIEEKELWSFVQDNVIEINGYYFAGCPWVPDHPFGYKYWVRKEFHDLARIDPEQFCEPLEIKNHNYVEIDDYKRYLEGKKPIYDVLVDTAFKVKDIKKSIWLIHAPPSESNLDVCSHGKKVGSQAVRHFIDEFQPFLVISGHIHESPEYSKQWYAKIGNTLCIQGGQIGRELHYVVMDIEDGTIKNMKHSIYGE